MRKREKGEEVTKEWPLQVLHFIKLICAHFKKCLSLSLSIGVNAKSCSNTTRNKKAKASQSTGQHNYRVTIMWLSCDTTTYKNNNNYYFLKSHITTLLLLLSLFYYQHQSDHISTSNFNLFLKNLKVPYYTSSIELFIIINRNSFNKIKKNLGDSTQLLVGVSLVVGMADMIALWILLMSLSLSLTSDNGVHDRSYSNLYEPTNVFGGLPPHSCGREGKEAWS